MTGGLVQITSFGSQDIMLSGNPQITFFTMIYRRYTNFGKITIEQNFDSKIDFNSRSTMIIPKVGDLLSNITLRIKLPKYSLIQLNNLLTQVQNSNSESINLLTYVDFFNSYFRRMQIIINDFINNSINLSNIANSLYSKILDSITTSEIQQIINIINYIFPNQNIASYYIFGTLFTLNNNTLSYIFEDSPIDFTNLCMVLKEVINRLTLVGKKLYETHVNSIEKEYNNGLD